MAQRLGTNSPLTRGLSGAFGAISDIAGQSLANEQKQKNAEASSEREVFRSLLKDVTDKVAAGSLEPEQAEQALALQGFPVPRGYFASLQPSVESGLTKIVGSIDKAKGYNDVPGPKALDAALPKRLGPSVDLFGPNTKTQGNANVPIVRPDGSVAPETPPQGPVPSTPIGNVSTPEFQRLLSLADEKKSSFAPERIDRYNPTTATKETAFVSADPTTLTGRSFQTAPSPTQEGENQATTVLTGLKTRLAGGAGTLQGGLDTQQENAGRAAKVKTAGATTAATTQAALDVNTAPGNVAKEADRASALAYATGRAQDKARIDGVDPAVAKTFVKGTSSGRSYAVIPADADPQTKRDAFTQFAKAGIPIVDEKTGGSALQQAQLLRANIDTILDEFQGVLPKGPAGRPISAAANTIAAYLQTNPDLAATAQNYASVIQGFRALAGATNLRITQGEIKAALDAQINKTDTWDTALRKAAVQNKFLTNIENAWLGAPK